MSHFRRAWAALGGAGLLLAFAASAAFAISPFGPRIDGEIGQANHGRDVSEAAHEEDATGESVSLVARGCEEDAGGEPADSHGLAVRAVAMNEELEDGPNDNHGGAVSEVARCGASEPVEATETEEEEDLDVTVEVLGEPAPQAEHGVAVSEAARDVTLTGGPNDNHGGYVSEIARQNAGGPPADVQAAGAGNGPGANGGPPPGTPGNGGNPGGPGSGGNPGGPGNGGNPGGNGGGRP
jgi:hypothetical protein